MIQGNFKHNTIVIGVSGGSASGKTTVAHRIKDEFRDNVELLSHDFYYLPFDDKSIEERKKLNFDHPNAFDTQKLIQHIKELKAGNPVERPVYSYTEFTRLKETIRVHPARVIIVEGFLIYENAELRDLFDIKIFVDTDADERLIRRIERDVNERGRTIESVISQYIHTVKPMHEQFVEPYKKYADIIIPRGGMNRIAIDMLLHQIHGIIHQDIK